ncbi:hypothetical protein E4U21_004605 [Claviceps maximensis]|nr:hypothetical protein E4U21_004605 [Claviceps maximensis]
MASIKHNALVSLEDPIDEFFEKYHQFDYDPHAEVWSEFHRMCDFFNWTRDDKKKRKAGDRFREAIVAQFGVLYGEDENKLDVLQRLCEKLDICPIPQSIKSCKKDRNANLQISKHNKASAIYNFSRQVLPEETGEEKLAPSVPLAKNLVMDKDL